MPERLSGALHNHPQEVRRIHQQDLAAGWGRVELPHALARKYPNAPVEWGWQWVFAQQHRWHDPKTGNRSALWCVLGVQRQQNASSAFATLDITGWPEDEFAFSAAL